MENSRYIENPDLHCPYCDKQFTGGLWFIIDVEQRPDLLKLVLQGGIRAVKCPHCNRLGEVDAPLLIYRPKDSPPLIYVRDEGLSKKENIEPMLHLYMTLKRSVGEDWQDEEWLRKKMYFIKLSELSLYLAEHV